MSLMSRIKVTSFLNFSHERKVELIKSIQFLRVNAIEESKIKKAGKMTKTQRKIRKKKGKLNNTKSKAIAALAKLSPEELLKTLGMFE